METVYQHALCEASIGVTVYTKLCLR